MENNNKTSRRIWIFSVTALIIFLGIIISFRIKFPNTYHDFIDKTAQKYEVDSALVASVIAVESGYRERVKSNRGAIGLMQLMPSTARFCAEKVGLNFTEEMLYDGETNIVLGSYYLSYLSKKFDNIDDILASYNAGEGNVLKWKKEGKSIPFPETINYIKKVKRAYKIYKRVYYR